MDLAFGVGLAQPFAVEAVDRATDRPPYLQVMARLERAIALGELVAGQLLPSERHLSTQFGVSRPTVRRALEELTRGGRLVRVANVGTFVADQRLRLGESLSFTDRVRRAGRTPSSRVVSQGVTGPLPAINRLLRLGAAAELVRIARVRLVDSLPIMLQESYLHAEPFRELLREDLAVHSLYGLMRDRFGVPVESVTETVRACLIPPTEAALLGCAPNSPGLRREFVAFGLRGEPLEYCRALVRGDVVSLDFTVTVGSPSTVEMVIAPRPRVGRPRGGSDEEVPLGG